MVYSALYAVEASIYIYRFSLHYSLLHNEIYTVGHKSANLVLSVTSSKISGFHCWVLKWTAHVMVWTSPTSPHECQHCSCRFSSQQKLHQMCHSFIEMDQCHMLYIYLFGVLYTTACTKQRFITRLMTCVNAWCKLGLTLNGTLSTLRLTSGVTVWYHVLVVDTLNTWSAMNVQKTSFLWFIRNFYETLNVSWCI